MPLVVATNPLEARLARAVALATLAEAQTYLFDAERVREALARLRCIWYAEDALAVAQGDAQEPQLQWSTPQVLRWYDRVGVRRRDGKKWMEEFDMPAEFDE